MHKNRSLIFIALIALVSLMIAPGMAAATENGTLFEDLGVVQSLMASNTADTTPAFTFAAINLTTYEISSCNGLQVVLVNLMNSGYSQYIPYGYGTYTSGQTRFSSSYGSGDIGYQVLYTSGGSYSGTSIYVVFDDPLVVTTTGPKTIQLTYNPADLHGFRVDQVISTTGYSKIRDGSGNYMMTIQYTSGSSILMMNSLYTNDVNGYARIYNNINKRFENQYSVSLGGLGAEGKIEKRGLTGAPYASKVFVYKSDGTTLQASETTLNTNDFNFNVQSYPLYIRITNAYGRTLNSSLLLVTDGIYNLSFSSKTITPGGSTTATVRAALGTYADLVGYTLLCNSNSGGSPLNIKYAGNDPSFVYSGGSWKQIRDSNGTYSITYGAGFPSSLVLTGFDSPGEYTCEGAVWSTKDYPKMYVPITVTGSSTSRTVIVNVQDSSSGAYINGAVASLKLADGTWYNKTVTSGPVQFPVKDREYIGYVATAYGYETTSPAYRQITQDTTIDIPLWKPLPIAPAGNATLSFYVQTASSGKWKTLGGALVVLSDGQTKYTPESGLAVFQMIANQSWSVTVDLSGYNRQTMTGTCGATSCGGYSIILTPTSANPTITTTTAGAGSSTGTGTGTSSGIAGNGTPRAVAQKNFEDWQLWGGTILGGVVVIMLIGFTGQALGKWRWLWK